MRPATRAGITEHKAGGAPLTRSPRLGSHAFDVTRRATSTTAELKYPVRNKFEARVREHLPAHVEYEAIKLDYTREHTYLPDFIDRDTKTIYEAKGRLCPIERGKLLAIKRCNPEWRFVIVLQYPNRKISKASRTTYAEWCSKNGFEWMAVS